MIPRQEPGQRAESLCRGGCGLRAAQRLARDRGDSDRQRERSYHGRSELADALHLEPPSLTPEALRRTVNGLFSPLSRLGVTSSWTNRSRTLIIRSTWPRPQEP